MLEQIAREMPSKKPEAVMAGLPALADAEKDPLKAGILRRATVYGGAALDELGPVVDALGRQARRRARRGGAGARAWIGRGPGQDQKLYDFLQADKKFSKGQSAIVLDLLHSFGNNDLARPGTVRGTHRRAAPRPARHPRTGRLAPVPPGAGRQGHPLRRGRPGRGAAGGVQGVEEAGAGPGAAGAAAEEGEVRPPLWHGLLTVPRV